MPHGLDKKLKNGRSIADVAFAPLADEPVVVDIGARNGMHQTVIPGSYASRSAIVGFEPNPEEYAKLVARDTDAERIGAPMSRFASERYFNCAVWEKEETRPFYITAGAGACTLMGKADEAICRNLWLEGEEKSYAEMHADVRATTPVECKRLDHLMPGNLIDILKIDVEGGELAVLKGAQQLLEQKNILFIKSEFLLAPLYPHCPLLGHQQALLAEHGFRLIGMDFDHAPYTRSKTRIPLSADRRLIYGGDAYFMLDPDKNALDAMKLHRLGLAALAFHFSSLAISLFREANLLSSADIDAVEAALAQNWTSRRVRAIWNQIPRRIKDIFR